MRNMPQQKDGYDLHKPPWPLSGPGAVMGLSASHGLPNPDSLHPHLSALAGHSSAAMATQCNFTVRRLKSPGFQAASRALAGGVSTGASAQTTLAEPTQPLWCHQGHPSITHWGQR